MRGVRRVQNSSVLDRSARGQEAEDTLTFASDSAISLVQLTSCTVRCRVRVGAPTNSELTNEGGYILEGDAWWVRTGHPTYDAAKFYGDHHR